MVGQSSMKPDITGVASGFSTCKRCHRQGNEWVSFSAAKSRHGAVGSADDDVGDGHGYA